MTVTAQESTASGQFLGVAVPAFRGLWAEPSQRGKGSLALGRYIFLGDVLFIFPHSSPRPLSPPRSPQRGTFQYSGAKGYCKYSYG